MRLEPGTIETDMPESPCYPAWLEARAIADEHMGEAYEFLGPQARAVLKKCIARLHLVWGEQPAQEKNIRQFRQGFSIEVEETPAPFALIVCEASYAWPAAFLAALMPAILAGVETILPCFVAEASSATKGVSAVQNAPADPLLAALELAGVERAFMATEEDVLGLLAEIHANLGNGRLIVLGSAAFAEPFVLHAHRAGIVCRSFSGPPLFHSERLGGIVENSFDRVAVESPVPGDAPLHLDSTHEDVWIWPELGPSWFRPRRMRLFSHGAKE